MREVRTVGFYECAVEDVVRGEKHLWEVRNFHGELMTAGLEKTQDLAWVVSTNVATAYMRTTR